MTALKRFLFICLLSIITPQVFSQGATEIYKALPEPYSQNFNDRFGSSVAIDGDYAVVGAPGYRDDFGCAYVLFKNGDTWENIAQLKASDAWYDEEFGCSVGISGDIIVVGARNEECAYVFTKPASGWKDTTQTAILTASDGVYNDDFGASVSISGDYIVIGANQDDDRTGSAYVFAKPPNGWVDTTQTAKLTASDGASGDEFGISVCISGDHIVIGSDRSKNGSAYVFTKPTNGWVTTTQTAILKTSDDQKYDWFGESVSISGDNIVVGARRDDINGSSSGSAYVFTKPLGGWINTTNAAKLTLSDGGIGDNFGQSVCISGDIIVIGACEDEHIIDDNSGSAYIFTKPAGGWVDAIQTAKIVASDGTTDSHFGRSISISGEDIIVGTPKDDESGENSGSAYAFTKPVSGWVDKVQDHKIVVDTYKNAIENNFGESIAIDGDYAVIGTSGYKDRHGCAYVFYKNENSWEKVAKLLPSDSIYSGRFGNAVSISGDNILIGANCNDDNGNQSGAAYVYTKPINGWKDTTQTAKLTASDGESFDYFGESVCISGNYVVVSASGDDEFGEHGDAIGSAYVFAKPEDGWKDTTQTAKLVASDGALGDLFGQSVSISGDHIVVGACGDYHSTINGYAYVFTKPVSGWTDATETAKLTASDGSEQDRFGNSVSISGDYIIVGAHNNDNIKGEGSGSAYVYKKPAGGWEDATENEKLIAPDGMYNDHFGYSVGISGDHIIVGTNGFANYSREYVPAYMFVKSDDSWNDSSKTAILRTSDENRINYFGYSVSISGDNIGVGAYKDDDLGYQSGSAYFYLRENPPTIISQPVDKLDMTAGNNIPFIVTAENADQYKWQYSSDGGNNFSDIEDNTIYSNANTATLNVAADYDLANYKFRCVVSNGWGFVISDTVLITIVNVAPTNIELSNNIIDENQPAGTIVGIFTVIDENVDDKHTFEFVPGNGSNDANNSLFSILGDTLKTNAVLDYETLSRYYINIQTQDAEGAIYEKSFTISVNDVTSIEFDELVRNGVLIYPNPATDVLNLEFIENSSREIKIYDITGKVIIAKECSNQIETIDISGLSKGIYIVNIQTGVKSFSYKILKE